MFQIEVKRFFQGFASRIKMESVTVWPAGLVPAVQKITGILSCFSLKVLTLSLRNTF